jgi:hypothetical protein
MENRDTYIVLVGKSEGKDNLEDVGACGIIILKLIFQKQYRRF